MGIGGRQHHAGEPCRSHYVGHRGAGDNASRAALVPWPRPPVDSGVIAAQPGVFKRPDQRRSAPEFIEDALSL